jgi:hypothetical protein
VLRPPYSDARTMPRRVTWERVVAVVGAVVALVLIAAALAVAFDAGRWGCKSQAELERTRPLAEIAAAFAEAGAELTPTQLPRAVVGRGRAYRGATAYRYDRERATLWVLVCPARCAGARPGLDRPVLVDGRYLRQFSTLGNNIAIFTTDNDRRSGGQLQARVQHIVNDLDVVEEYGSRCYIQ